MQAVPPDCAWGGIPLDITSFRGSASLQRCTAALFWWRSAKGMPDSAKPIWVHSTFLPFCFTVFSCLAL